MVDPVGPVFDSPVKGSGEMSGHMCNVFTVAWASIAVADYAECSACDSQG